MKYREYFWKQKAFVPKGIGYGQFSTVHLILIGITVIFTVAVSYVYNTSSAEVRSIIRIALAVALIITEIAKYSVIIIGHGDLKNYLPLEICSVAGYCMIIDSLMKGTSFITEMLLILFLPAAIMALIYPTSVDLPAINFFTIHQFIYHALIVAYVTARFSAGEIVMNYKGVWLSILTIFIIGMIVYLIDRIFHKNFMFLIHDERNAMLKKITAFCGKGFGYTAGLVTFCIIVIHIFYFLFKLLETIFLR